MRALIVADIHSNLEAFQAVLEDAQSTGGFDEVWCLGDTVGYGPDPGPCIDLLWHHPHRAVAGNHDWGATGKISIEDFNPYAAAACRWTAQQLTPTHQRYLLSLPETEQWGDFTLVHGSLRSPIWEYLVSPESALETFRLLKRRYCLVGHSHLPFICRELPEGCAFTVFPEGMEVPLQEERWIVNPGGVGQPRDGDPRPSYVLYDAQRKTVLQRRVAYDIAATQEKMRRAGLPTPLIERLDFGR